MGLVNNPRASNHLSRVIAVRYTTVMNIIMLYNTNARARTREDFDGWTVLAEPAEEACGASLLDS